MVLHFTAFFKFYFCILLHDEIRTKNRREEIRRPTSISANLLHVLSSPFTDFSELFYVHTAECLTFMFLFDSHTFQLI